MSADTIIDINEEGDVLIIRAESEVVYKPLGGEETPGDPITIAEAVFPAEEELVKDIAHALLGWCADQQSPDADRD